MNMDLELSVERMAKNDPEWLKEIRLQSLRKFEEMSMPDIKDENWKYTDLGSVDFSELKEDDTEISFVNPNKEITAMPMKEMIKNNGVLRNFFLKTEFSESEKKFVFLNNMLFGNGCFINIPSDTHVSIPLEVNFSSSHSSFSHSIIILENNSSLDIFERLNSSEHNKFFFNIAEIFLGENSKLNYYHLQNLGKNSFSFIIRNSIIKKDAELNWFAGSFGGRLNRSKIVNNFLDQGARSETLCMFSGNSDQHFDVITTAHHIAPNTKNNILTRGILFDSCSSVYRGLIKIDKEAQKTDSYLSDHTLLMSEKSLANSVPSLQIDANDVKATHGASVGQINEEEIFYLMSRGLSRNEAEKTIVNGFFEKFLSKIKHEIIRKEFEESIQRKVV